MPEVREAGTDVVDRKLGTTLAQRCKRVAQRVVVVDLSVLRDLDHDSAGDVQQQLGEAWVECGRR